MNKDNSLELELLGSFKNDANVDLLEKSIIECSRLKSLTWFDSDHCKEFEYLLDSRPLFLKEIEDLSFNKHIEYDSEIRKLVADLDECVNLKELNLFCCTFPLYTISIFARKDNSNGSESEDNYAMAKEKDKIIIWVKKFPDKYTFYRWLY